MDLAAITTTLSTDPGDPVFADYAEHLRLEGKHIEAQQVCLKGLSINPSCHKGRLILARVYYDQQLMPFALRELYQISEALPDRQSVRRLITRLGGTPVNLKAGPASDTIAAPAAIKDTVAEVEFDFDALAEVESKENQKNR